MKKNKVTEQGGARDVSPAEGKPDADQLPEKTGTWFGRKLRLLRNTVMELLQTGLTPRKMALAITIGFICGTIPLYGTHTIAAVLIGIAFRLNQVLLNIGVWVSLPAFVALIVPSLRLGERLFGAPALDWPTLKTSLLGMFSAWAVFKATLIRYGESLLHMMAGWIIIMAITAIPLYFICYIIIRRLPISAIRKEAAS